MALAVAGTLLFGLAMMFACAAVVLADVKVLALAALLILVGEICLFNAGRAAAWSPPSLECSRVIGAGS